jgi:hypothetical protein
MPPIAKEEEINDDEETDEEEGNDDNCGDDERKLLTHDDANKEDNDVHDSSLFLHADEDGESLLCFFADDANYGEVEREAPVIVNNE